MRTQELKVKMISLAALIAVMSLGACTKSDPVKPNNEIIEKLHEAPAKAVFTLTDASLDASRDLNYENLGAIQMGQNVQVITFAQEKGAAFRRTEDSATEFRVKTSEQDPNALYHLDIKYYSPSGKEMNYQFIENGQDAIHQHYFTIYDKNGLLVRDQTKIPYFYIYADKNDKGQFFPKNNPIGMQGFFRFRPKLGEQDVKIELIHFFQSKYGDGGELSPYYAASKKVKSRSDTDVSLRVKFVEVSE